MLTKMLKKLLASLKEAKRMQQECWIFNDFRLVSDKDLLLLKRIKATDVVIGLNEETEVPFRLRWDGGNTTKAIQATIDNINKVRDSGIRPHIMVWLRPEGKYNKDAFKVVQPIISAANPASTMFDLEFYWNRVKTDHEKAVEQYVLPFWSSLSADHKFGVTSFAALPAPVVALLNDMWISYYVPQAYSILNPRMDWTKSPLINPGTLQEHAYNSWAKKARPDQNLVMALAAYSLSRPGFSPLKNVVTCLDACKRLGVTRYALWSTKHLHNDTDLAEFIRMVNVANYLGE